MAVSTEKSIDIRSMTYEEDGLSQASADASHGTLYTVTNYSGKGILSGLVYSNSNAIEWTYIVITTDGNAHTWDADGVSAQIARAHNQNYSTGTVIYLQVPIYLEFDTSLLVQIANDGAAAYDITGQTHYAIFSKEIKREIIPANGALPDREETYPFDVMVVFFEGPFGVSSKIQFPQNPKVDLWLDSNGKIAGALRRFEFNTEIGSPARYNKVKHEVDTVENVYFGSNKYQVPIINGVVDEAGIIKSVDEEKSLKKEFLKK